jgi:hypothetical protein
MIDWTLCLQAKIMLPIVRSPSGSVCCIGSNMANVKIDVRLNPPPMRNYKFTIDNVSTEHRASMGR